MAGFAGELAEVASSAPVREAASKFVSEVFGSPTGREIGSQVLRVGDRVAASGSSGIIGATEYLNRLELAQPQAIRNAGSQANPGRLINGILTELSQEGRIDSHWKLYLTEPGSPLDMAKADALLVHAQSGAVHLVDFTKTSLLDDNKVYGNRAMREQRVETWFGPGEYGYVPPLCRDGLARYAERHFDQFGALSDDPNIVESTQRFRSRLTTQIIGLTDKPSPLNLNEMPYLDSLPQKPQTAFQQLQRFQTWSLAHQEPLVQDYGHHLKDAVAHADAQANAGSSTALNQVLQRHAERVIFKHTVTEQIKPGSALAEIGPRAVSSATGPLVEYNPKSDRLSLTHAGKHFESDPLTGRDGVFNRAIKTYLVKCRSSMANLAKDKKRYCARLWEAQTIPMPNVNWSIFLQIVEL